jgi:hypothetical protein
MSVMLLLVTLIIVVAAQARSSAAARPSRLARRLVGVALALATRARPAGRDRIRSTWRPATVGRWTALLGGSGLFFLCAPLMIILILSFSDAPFLTFPPEGFSLRW